MEPKCRKKIDQFVHQYMKKGKIPGLSICIVQDGKNEMLTYGYANKKEKQMVCEYTLFELGSMSKSFTCLGILLLEEWGLIRLEDDIKKYIPELSFYYNGSLLLTPVTIKDFLYHTSGIPFSTLLMIPKDSSCFALSRTVRALNNVELKFLPGKGYEYASNNMNILAYLIERTTNESFESFMHKHIFEPLKLFHTYAGRNSIPYTENIATGYRVSFFAARSYKAPIYRGNIAGGYIVSCANDMTRWLNIQMGTIIVCEDIYRCIQKSHEPQFRLPEDPNYYMGAGWSVEKSGSLIKYRGLNPNFSSFILFDKRIRYGVCVLGNINTNICYYLGENMLFCSRPNAMAKYTGNSVQKLDYLFSIMTIVAFLTVVFQSFVFFKSLQEGIDIKFDFENAFLFYICTNLMIFNNKILWNLPGQLTRYKIADFRMHYIWGGPHIILGQALVLISNLITLILIMIK